MTTRIALTSSLFLAAMLLLPASMASAAELTGACLKDAKAQCPGVTPGGGKIRDCLKTHIQDLSDVPPAAYAYPPATNYAPPPEADYGDAPPSGGDYNDEGNYGNGQPQEGDYAGAPPPEGY